MRFSLLTTSFLTLASFVSAEAVAVPASPEFEVELAERGIVSDIAGEVLSHINFEGVAGFANKLLTENDNVRYLDNVLTGLKDLNLIPAAATFIITNNFTRHIAAGVIEVSLPVLLKANTTSLFVALDQSGLVYSIVAGAVEDPKFFPSIITIVKKFLASGAINFSQILSAGARLIGLKREAQGFSNEEVFENFKRKYEPETSVYDMTLDKRDNVEDLLITVFSSVERSGLLPETVSALVEDPSFQDAIVILLKGYFENIGSKISSTNLSALRPLLTSLLESGLLTHTIERALKDKELLNALLADVGGLLKIGSIKKADLMPSSNSLGQIKKSDIAVQDVGVLENKDMVSSISSAAVSSSTIETSSASASSSSGKPSLSSSAGAANLDQSSPLSSAFLGLSALISIMLI